jgi:hypothetical protein
MKNPEYRDKSRNAFHPEELCEPVARQERRFQRFDLHCEVKLKLQIGNEFKEIIANSKNISVGGFLLSTNWPLTLHTAVSFFMIIRSSSLVRPIHLTGAGQIVRIKLVSPGSYAVAVECTTPMIQIEPYLAAIAFC